MKCKHFYFVLVLLFLVCVPVFSSSGNTIEITKTEWEQIQTLSNKLLMESKKLTVDLNNARTQLKMSQTQLNNLEVSYNTLKTDNDQFLKANSILKIGCGISVTLGIGALIYAIIK